MDIAVVCTEDEAILALRDGFDLAVVVFFPSLPEIRYSYLFPHFTIAGDLGQSLSNQEGISKIGSSGFLWQGVNHEQIMAKLLKDAKEYPDPDHKYLYKAYRSETGLSLN